MEVKSSDVDWWFAVTVFFEALSVFWFMVAVYERSWFYAGIAFFLSVWFALCLVSHRKV